MAEADGAGQLRALSLAALACCVILRWWVGWLFAYHWHADLFGYIMIVY